MGGWLFDYLYKNILFLLLCSCILLNVQLFFFLMHICNNFYINRSETPPYERVKTFHDISLPPNYYYVFHLNRVTLDLRNLRRKLITLAL